jgi:mercuric ion transport protein
MTSNPNKPLLLAGLAAIGATACCVGPLILLLLGIGGSWISSLTALEPYRPIFIIATILFIGLAYRKLYLINDCDDSDVCAISEVKQRQRTIFWVSSIIIIVIVTSPYYLPLLLE